MTLPKMILFDYGHTLAHEKGVDPLRGEEELFRYIKTNKNNLAPRDVNEAARRLDAKMRIIRDSGFELHWHQFYRLLNERLGIEFALSCVEAEKVFWDAVYPGEPMPGIVGLLDFISSLGIRSGVISNTMFSSEAMAERINRLLPENKFEFIMTSSEYGVRKPDRMLFDIALTRAGLGASEVWYCGDNPEADVTGAAGAGIFPVWYTSDVECFYRDKSKEAPPLCPHLRIREWDELIELLDTLKSQATEK